jgi:flagellar motor switch protein FliN/FliY
MNAPMNESIASFFDALTGELQRLLSQDEEQVTVSWRRPEAGHTVPELIWWSCALSVDPACRLFAGTDRQAVSEDPQETWHAVLTQSIELAAKAKFGALVSCQDLGTSEDPPNAWAKVPVAIVRGGRSSPEMYLALSPDLATALGGDAEAPSVEPEKNDVVKGPAAANPLEIIQHVEIPVSVSFGRTNMRLKDLLSLVNGSVVQLDRELGDEVEIRVNNCVIARGEVVAVEGNYGVRILKMMSGALRAN